MKKKKAMAAQTSLDGYAAQKGTGTPAPAEAASVEAVWREYEFGAQKFRVNRFDLLAAEMSSPERAFAAKDLPVWHGVVCGQVRPWLICRRLFGIGPALISMAADVDEGRTFERIEVQEKLGLSRAELAQELDRVRGMWLATVKAEGAVKTPTPVAKEELTFTVEAVLKRHGLLELVAREEQMWMAARLEGCEKMLTHPQVGELVRTMLLTELELRRLQERCSKTTRQMVETLDMDVRERLDAEYEMLFKRRTLLSEQYQNMMATIDKIFPFMKAVAGNMTFKGVASDFVSAHAEYARTRTNEIADGVFTAAEIEILMRTSVQAPEPQYRLGQVVYLNMARAFLWDPAWKPNFSPATFRKLDAGFRAAAMEESKAMGEELTDLLSDDPVKGEYPPLPAPPKELAGPAPTGG